MKHSNSFIKLSMELVYLSTSAEYLLSMENDFYFSSSNSPIKLKILLLFPNCTWFLFSLSIISPEIFIFRWFSLVLGKTKTLNTGRLVIAPDKTLPKSSQFLGIFPYPNKYLNSNAWINFYLIWGQIYWISRYCV